MAVNKTDVIIYLRMFLNVLKSVKSFEAEHVEKVLEGLVQPSVILGEQSPVEDYNVINRLDKLLKEKCCRIIFNQDDQDGFFCEIDGKYSFMNNIELADLKPSTKRPTLLSAMIAAVQYLESK